MVTLYPPIQPYKQYALPVTKPHVLYLEEVGNPEGIPVIVLHSGPGTAGNPNLRRFFDPQSYRIILFDQRGCGRSTPHGEIHHNRTPDLLDDIDTIRDFLGLTNFVLFGGGWGALLALLYTQRHPQHIRTLLLYQIFLGRKKDIAWLYQTGANLVYPDYWQEFINLVPFDEQNQIIPYYSKCLQGSNELARMAAAKNWALWQAHCSSLQPHSSLIEEYSDPHFALTLATLGLHFLNNRYFIEENQVLANTHKIRHIPTYLVHGRYDMISPLANAWELHQALSASNLKIVRDAGHSEYEAGIIDALIMVSKEISHQSLDVS